MVLIIFLFTKAGNSALHLAAQNKKDMVEIVDILLNWGFSIHKTDKVWLLMYESVMLNEHMITLTA